MIELRIIVRPESSALLIGGQTAPSRGGDKATARTASRDIVIPASALRGALRIELERLLRGRDGDGAACSGTGQSAPEPATSCLCPVCRLFGQPGLGTGTLRLEDAILGSSAQRATVRPQVAVSRRTRTAREHLLAFVETTDTLGSQHGEDEMVAAARLFPRGSQDSSADLEADLLNLQAACAALRAIGGGKARGLGWVSCSVERIAALESSPAPPRRDSQTQRAPTAPTNAETVVVRFLPESPLHFGSGRPIGYFHTTLRHAPGSAVRGAIAFSMLESGRCQPADRGFESLFTTVDALRPSFGSARLAGDIPCVTRRACRPNQHVFDDLIAELVRRAAARAGIALRREGAACPEPGCGAEKTTPAARRLDAMEAIVRVRTRTALNRHTGTAMDRRLYSLEVLEPYTTGGEPLILESTIAGLTVEAASLLRDLDGSTVWLGGKRSRGMGRCRLTVLGGEPTGAKSVLAAMEELDRELRRSLTALDIENRALAADESPMAIVLTEPWLPNGRDSDALHTGPLGATGEQHLPLLDAFVELSEQGRFGANEADYYSAPPAVARGEVPPVEAAAPGSVYVYRVRRDVLHQHWDEWLALGKYGSGLNCDLGWGRFSVRGADPGF